MVEKVYANLETLQSSITFLTSHREQLSQYPKYTDLLKFLEDYPTPDAIEQQVLDIFDRGHELERKLLTSRSRKVEGEIEKYNEEENG